MVCLLLTKIFCRQFLIKLVQRSNKPKKGRLQKEILQTWVTTGRTAIILSANKIYRRKICYTFNLFILVGDTHTARDTYIDFLPLANVSDEAGEAQESDKWEELGEAQDAESAARVQDVETLQAGRVIALGKDKLIHHTEMVDYWDQVGFVGTQLWCGVLRSIWWK